MALLDEVQLNIRAGKGGDGVVRWRREKFKPLSGPGGGNGGNGANVYAVGTRDLAALENYRFKKAFFAADGEAGGNHGRHGANGKDLELVFPVGSVLHNNDTGETFEILNDTDRILILTGGRGGLGNEYFKSSTNTTPYEWTPGKMGQQGHFKVELKLIADIGLIGKPSTGKSTLINALTNTKAKTAEYHFTTLEPNLGALPEGVIIADIPGLIEGASAGKGLGHKFLKHIQRTKILVHLISADSGDVVSDYTGIRSELDAFDDELTKKPEIVVLSRSDLVSPEEVFNKISSLRSVYEGAVVAVSSFEDDLLDDLRQSMLLLLSKS